MNGFPSVRDPGSIEKLLLQIGTAEPPARADRDFLNALGLRREADNALIEMLGFLGFTGAAGDPTELWIEAVREGGMPPRLGRAVRSAYSSLFSALPDAPGTDGTVLMDFFRKATGAADPEVAYMVLTFKILCDLAVFPPEEPAAPTPPPHPVPEAAPAPPISPVLTVAVAEPVPAEPPTSPPCAEAPVIRLSIHIDVSGETDPEIRDLAQRLLKRHLEAGGN